MKRLLLLVVASCALAGCGTQSLASATRSWLSQSSFQSNTQTLALDVSHVTAVLKTNSASPNDLHTVCAVLLGDAEAANASLPAPDAQLSHLLSVSYSELGSAANECYRAGSSSDARLRALSFLHQAQARYAEATARLAVVVGR